MPRDLRTAERRLPDSLQVIAPSPKGRKCYPMCPDITKKSSWDLVGNHSRS